MQLKKVDAYHFQAEPFAVIEDASSLDVMAHERMATAGIKLKNVCVTVALVLAATPCFAQLEKPKTISQYNDWILSEEVSEDGRITYRATLTERSNSHLMIQFTCSPSKRNGFTLLLLDSTIKSTTSQKVLVIFNNTHTGVVDQFESTANSGQVDLQPLFLESTGCARCNSATDQHNGLLFLAVRDRKMVFNPSGTPDEFDELDRRCHF